MAKATRNTETNKIETHPRRFLALASGCVLTSLRYLRVFFLGIGQMWMSGLSSYSVSIPCWCLGNRLTPWWRKSVSWWSPWLETSTLRRTTRTQGSGQIHYIQWYDSIDTLYIMQCLIKWRGLYNVNKIEYNHFFTLFLPLLSLVLRRG